MGKKGFTLVELFIVITILLLMIIIFIMKFNSLSFDIKRYKCKARKATVEANLTAYYVRAGVAGPAVFPHPDGTGRAEFAAQFFPDRGIPTCPFDGEAYVWSEDTGKIIGHEHEPGDF